VSNQAVVTWAVRYPAVAMLKSWEVNEVGQVLSQYVAGLLNATQRHSVSALIMALFQFRSCLQTC
jgi:hypothetical protein